MAKRESNKKQFGSIDTVISFLQTRPDVGGFIIQKNEDTIEFDGYFSDEFLGKTPEEAFGTLTVVIASMRNMADTLTKRLIALSGVPENDVKKGISEMYYEISKTEPNKKDDD
jgi:hypothetical protein